jgi:hypothetical protein
MRCRSFSRSASLTRFHCCISVLSDICFCSWRRRGRSTDAALLLRLALREQPQSSFAITACRHTRQHVTGATVSRVRTEDVWMSARHSDVVHCGNRTTAACQATRETDPLTTRGIDPLRARRSEWKSCLGKLSGPRNRGTAGGPGDADARRRAGDAQVGITGMGR